MLHGIYLFLRACAVIVILGFGLGLLMASPASAEEPPPAVEVCPPGQIASGNYCVPAPEENAPTSDNPETGCVPIEGVEDCGIAVDRNSAGLEQSYEQVQIRQLQDEVIDLRTDLIWLGSYLMLVGVALFGGGVVVIILLSGREEQKSESTPKDTLVK